MKDALRTLRQTGRSLARQPGWSLVILLVLALAIGAVGALFSVVDGVLLRSLPFPEPDRLVMVWESNPGRGVEANPTSAPNFLDWQAQEGEAFTSLAAYFTANLTLTGEWEPLELTAAGTTADFFSTLGMEPVLGRFFTPEEDRLGAGNVVVLNEGLWRRRFGGDRDIIGRSIELDGQTAVVVGVADPALVLPAETDLWFPLALDPEDAGSRGGRYLRVVGRLAEGVSPTQAQTRMETVGQRLAAAYPDANLGWEIRLVPLREDLTGDVRPTLTALFLATLAVLAIACVNIANLLLARGNARRGELAVHLALGSGRRRLAGRLLAESLLLGFVGGAMGLVLAGLGVALIKALGPQDLPRLAEVGLDLRGVGFSLLVSLAAGVLCGVTPAWLGTRQPLASVLRVGGRGSEGGGGRVGRLLVILEIALAFGLLTAAGFLATSFYRLLAADPGFEASGVLTARVELPPGRYPDSEPWRWQAFFDPLTETLAGLPDVRAVGAASYLPITGTPRLLNNRFTIVGRPAGPDERLFAYLRWASRDYFRALGVPLLAGRAFNELDRPGNPEVVIIDQAMADRYFPGQDPLGQSLLIFAGERKSRRIVGVVGNVKQGTLEDPDEPHMYLPLSQNPHPRLSFVLDTSGDPLRLARPVREAVWALDRDLVVEVETLEQRLAESLAQRRFSLLLVLLFASAAVALAAVGLYGVMAYFVSSRRREIGVRIALGGQRKSVIAMVLRRGLILAAWGLGAGLLLALGSSFLLGSLLYGVEPWAPIPYLVMLGLLLGVTLLASYLPARSATRIPPVEALRSE